MTIHGKLIEIATKIKRESRAVKEHLEWELQSLSKEHKRRLSSDLLARIESTRFSLNLLLTAHSEKALWWSATTFYTHASV